MKFIQELLSNKSTRNFLIIVFVVLFLIPSLISYHPKPKITRQISRSSDDVQTLWEKDVFFRDYVVNWDSNTIYAIDPKTGNLLAIDGLTGETVWKARVPYGARELLISDHAVFAVTSYVSAFSISTGELLWTTRLDDAHASIYAQSEDDLLRVYYGNNIFEMSQASGEILSVQLKDNIVWIQNNVEIHCPITPSQDGAVERCWVGLIGVDHATGEIVWKNNKPIFSEDYQELSINDMLFVEFPDDGVCVLNPDNGEYDWCLPEGRISNIAIAGDEETGYFLRHDYSLVKINLLTGGILAEIQFLPMILPERMQKNYYDYKVAVTKDIVIVSFGDSVQTFGLKFNP